MTLQIQERVTAQATVIDNKQSESSLCDAVKNALVQYFDELEDTEPDNLYEMVIGEIEAPMLEIVMQQVNGNQTRAAAYLGLNRGTLRKKLRQHGLDKA